MTTATTTTTDGTHTFQAEIRQLLDIVVHSLYTDREIFIRELVSNASDALGKLRHLEGVEKEMHDAGVALEIHITTDEETGTLSINDRGIGMNREDLARHLGTIAHSGTKAWLQSFKEKGGSADGLIGQFGVGFYSAFMVASEVNVHTRSWQPDGEGLLWKSDGDGAYTIGAAEVPERGTKITLQLKADAKEFAKESRVRSILERYSNFVGFPIFLNGQRVNEVEALWLKNKSEVTEEQYEAFYKFTSHAFDKPAYRLHFAADAPLDIHALVFVPSENPERWQMGQVEPGVALYCRKVLIDPTPKGLLPEWMRFLKGVIDSQDLPLNISRESMQDSALVRKLGDVISKRVIKMLESEATADEAAFIAFYRKFERFFKEGVATDHTNKDALARLLRFESSLLPAGELTTFSAYRQRAKESQDQVYFLIGPTRAALEASPYLEAFKARGLEVLLLTDGVDQYVIDALREFEGKKLVSIDRAGLELDDLPTEGEELSAEAKIGLEEFLGATFGDRVVKVGAGRRLIDSPVVALVPEDAMSTQMRRMMKAMDENFNDEAKVEIEYNPRHPILRSLATAREKDPETAALVAGQLLDNALLAAGLLEDTKPTVDRMNALMAKVLGSA
ncbi:MAG: molecular chaperone HtpG [Verrucomicrobiales bacterium]